MNTLDKVITELKTIYDRYEAEGCFYCSFQRECTGGYCYLADALHYLKEYQAILPLMPSLINTAIAMQKKGKTIG